MHPLPVAVELDAFEHVLTRLLPRLAALAVHQLALERLEEGFRGRVVPWVARPRHGSGDPMRLEAALERPGSVLGTLVVVEDEAEVVGRALPSHRLLERIRDRLLGHAPGHRPAHDPPAQRVDHGCEAGQSFARSDAGDAARPWLVAGFDVERPVHEVRARVAHLDRLRAFALPARPLRLRPRLAHDGEHPFLADDDAVAPELAVDPAVPVAALVKIEPLGDEALQGLPLDLRVGFPLTKKGHGAGERRENQGDEDAETTHREKRPRVGRQRNERLAKRPHSPDAKNASPSRIASRLSELGSPLLALQTIAEGAIPFRAGA